MTSCSWAEWPDICVMGWRDERLQTESALPPPLNWGPAVTKLVSYNTEQHKSQAPNESLLAGRAQERQTRG
jgi:hypothetical protein